MDRNNNSPVGGDAALQYNPVGGNAAVRLTFPGLPANRKQTAFINAGHCTTLSQTPVPTILLHEDRSGQGYVPSMFPGNFAGRGWSVQVHCWAAPTSIADSFTVACGDIP